MTCAVSLQSHLLAAAATGRYLIRSHYSTITPSPAHRSIGRLRHSAHKSHHRVVSQANRSAVLQCSKTKTPWARLRVCNAPHDQPLAWTRGLHTGRPQRCSAATASNSAKEQIIAGVCFCDPPLIRNVFLLNSGKYTTLVHGEFNFDAVSSAILLPAA